MAEDYTTFEICAGGGGQAIGLEEAGFKHLGAVELDSDACDTLRQNRPSWTVLEGDVREFSGREWNGKIDLFAGGVPCPPFSVAGKQLGQDDERDLFPQALRMIDEIRPKAIMLENVRGFSQERFSSYRQFLFKSLSKLGYKSDSELLISSDYGVPQLRPRFLIVALLPEYFPYFKWPKKQPNELTVAQTIQDLMLSGGWPGGQEWLKKANAIAPTIVGGSKKHGGPDLGPSRARKAWKELGVNGGSIANNPPTEDFPKDSMPRLTLRMVARIQGFPDDWLFSGTKTAQYRQIGNAFPPPVAKAVAESIKSAISGKKVDEKDLPQGKTLDLFGYVSH